MSLKKRLAQTFDDPSDVQLKTPLYRSSAVTALAQPLELPNSNHRIQKSSDKMCGRYALGIRASFVRHQLQDHDMPVEEAPKDDEVRQTYNFAPGYHGLVYRADVPDHGAGTRHYEFQGNEGQNDKVSLTDVPPGARLEDQKETRYKLQSMKWGLVPFWTKRNPDYGSIMKTINARDDSLMENRGMWNSMKKSKRCIVVAQGFYEWLKKNGGKEKVPHFVKRKDGQLMCFAGLWDCVQYEGSEDKHYTYTIITTDSNKQLSFLHDRMPVVLENGSDQIRTWLDPNRSEWSKELQALLKPFRGEVECYPVSKDVGKVGNDSPSFIVPVASTKNKNNIANFFANTKKSAKGDSEKKAIEEQKGDAGEKGNVVEHIRGEERATTEQSRTEDNAPLPGSPPASSKKHDLDADEDDVPVPKAAKTAHLSSSTLSADKKESGLEAQRLGTGSSEKARGGRKTRSATSNGTKGSPAKPGDGSQRITSFFNR